MAKVKFIHTADLHLDTPFKGLYNWNQQLASELKDATINSFRKIIDLCILETVDFLLISGDIFDHENKSLAAQLKFVNELERLSEKGIPAYFICGNHDPLNSWIEDLQLPENVFRFGSTEVESITYQKNGEPFADLYGISYQYKVIKSNLARHYQLKENPSPVSIAILHGTAGSPGPHENYAPFKIEDITAKGFDYWALGHIHKRQVIRDKNPTVVYPGNPQGRDFGETGAKGCYMVEIDQDGTPELKFEPTQLIRFENLQIDLTEKDTINSLPGKVEKAITSLEDYEQNTSYIVRIALSGRTSLHAQLNKAEEVDQLLEYMNEDQLSQTSFRWIDRIEVKTQPDLDIEQIKKRKDFPAEIVKTIEQFENDPEKSSELIRNADEGFNSQRARLLLGPISEEESKEMIEKAKWMLLDQLVKEKE